MLQAIYFSHSDPPTLLRSKLNHSGGLSSFLPQILAPCFNVLTSRMIDLTFLFNLQSSSFIQHNVIINNLEDNSNKNIKQQ